MRPASGPLSKPLLLTCWAALVAMVGALGTLACDLGQPPAPIVAQPASEAPQPAPEPVALPCPPDCPLAGHGSAQPIQPRLAFTESRLRLLCDPGVRVKVARSAMVPPGLEGALAWTKELSPAEARLAGADVLIVLHADLSEMAASFALVHEWAHACQVGFAQRLRAAGERLPARAVEWDNHRHGPAWGRAYSEAYRAAMQGEAVRPLPPPQGDAGIGGLLSPGNWIIEWERLSR